MFLSTLLLLNTATAETVSYQADTAHSILEFEVDALLGPVHGTFKDWSIEVTVEDGDLNTLKGVATVNVATIDTRVAKRDKHLQQEDFFHVEVYPNATFTTKTAVLDEKGVLNVSGDLMMHGVTLPFEVPFTVVHQDEKRIRLSGEGTISRKSFGIDYQSKMNKIQDSVVLKFNLNLRPPRKKK